jgi:cytochrome P450
MAEAHGCQSPPRVINQRPFGVDRMEQIFRANSESRLMELFLFHFRFWGTTLEQIFLGTQAFGTIDPANLEAVLSTNFEDYGMGPRRKVMYPLFGDGIFTQEGVDWKHSRELLRPQFAYKQYEDMEVFRESVDNLLQAIPAKGVVDLQPLFFRLTLDVTTAFLFGESVDSLKTPESAGEFNFAKAFNTAQDFIAKRLRLQDLYWLIGGSKFRRACGDVHRFADQIIERNLSKESKGAEERKRRVFLDYLAQNTPDRKAMRSQIINILVAGRDTTACLISWTLWVTQQISLVRDKAKRRFAASFWCDIPRPWRS